MVREAPLAAAASSAFSEPPAQLPDRALGPGDRQWTARRASWRHPMPRSGAAASFTPAATAFDERAARDVAGTARVAAHCSAD